MRGFEIPAFHGTVDNYSPEEMEDTLGGSHKIHQEEDSEELLLAMRGFEIPAFHGTVDNYSPEEMEDTLGGSHKIHQEEDSEELLLAMRGFEIPAFDGTNPVGWLAMVERYSEIHGTPSYRCLRIAHLCMEGTAIHWFRLARSRNLNWNWARFAEELINRYSGRKATNPFEAMASLQQEDRSVGELTRSTVRHTPREENVNHSWEGRRRWADAVMGQGLIAEGYQAGRAQVNERRMNKSSPTQGKDVGLNQIALFEGKVAGDNGEQILSRDIYRSYGLRFAEQDAAAQRNASQVLEDMPLKCCPEIYLTGRVNLALSGVGETILDRAQISQNSSLNAALNAQFLFQIGVCTVVPMVLGLILVQGFLRALVSFVTHAILPANAQFPDFNLGDKVASKGGVLLWAKLLMTQIKGLGPF
ncbi:hypothetical protein F511_20146 [Dorcoceras hygrometricum]|uniref:Retrotransposon gag domain-containing protein n=1 Tax=Dorcoceras hygrometricum TaxID=472368 RepID=A0A2Z7AB07_9LAMI|nr:hypothetical protein F511_20146 [Dorcoceras hygrometricum]